MAQATKKKKATAAEVGRAYFECFNTRDLDALVEFWDPDGIETINNVDYRLPDEYRTYFSEVFGAFPDFALEVVDEVAEGDRYVARTRVSGTFAGPGSFQGFEPNGARIDAQTIDVLTIRDGKIVRNDALLDEMGIARQLGALPSRGSSAEQHMASAFNAKTRVGDRMLRVEHEQLADGLWVIRTHGAPPPCNVFMVADDDGFTMYDSGLRVFGRRIAAAAAQIGPIKRILLGHGHVDHRGGAPAIGAPVWCHPDEVQDAEGDGGHRYFDLSQLAPHTRFLHRRLERAFWDGGPVKIEGTLTEGDRVGDFEVVHIPGHAPGQVALWRESDRIALASDAMYKIQMNGRPTPPRVQHPAYNWDDAQAHESVRKLAALDPKVVWLGHADPIEGDVRAQLDEAAEAPSLSK